jgi:uncharacterized protein (TIGR02466 family)
MIEKRLETWFPTSIYVVENILTSSENLILDNNIDRISRNIKNQSNNWNCNTITSINSYDLINDTVFSSIKNLVEMYVMEYSDILGSSEIYRCKEMWFNINYRDSFQEYHCHPGSTISAVYYISVPPESGNIVFENPAEPDMLPLKNCNNNKYNFKTVKYSPKQGMLLIFRSYLRHMVSIGTNEKPRISIAFNF